MTILFLHGLGQNKEAWRRTIDILDRKDVACPDLIPIDGQKETFDSLMKLLESNCSDHTDPLILCGLSLGAVMSMEFYLRHPDRIQAMIFIAPQYKMPTFLLSLQSILFRLMPHKCFADSRITKENLISISKSMSHLDYRSDLSSIQCPVTIVCGEKDKANRKAAKSLSIILDHSKLILIEGVGHEVNREDPERLADIIRNVVEKTERESSWNTLAEK
ncbi:MAG: alpha/beta hydrolase [Peptoniphilaceae bacterium]|nr:alpha/beta hydrolase [Peptoniphilaceae bacterium]